MSLAICSLSRQRHQSGVSSARRAGALGTQLTPAGQAGSIATQEQGLDNHCNGHHLVEDGRRSWLGKIPAGRARRLGNIAVEKALRHSALLVGLLCRARFDSRRDLDSLCGRAPPTLLDLA